MYTMNEELRQILQALYELEQSNPRPNGYHASQVARAVDANRHKVSALLYDLKDLGYVRLQKHKLPSSKMPATEYFQVKSKGKDYLNGSAPVRPATHQAAVNAGTLGALHKQIQQKCSSLYLGGHYPEAVEKSFKVVRDRLRDLTTYEKGSDAFGRGSLFINGASAKNVEHDFQEAVKFLTMAIDQFRNEKSHTSDGKIEDPGRAYEYLALSSLAMHLLDDSEVKASENKSKLSKPSKETDKQVPGKTSVKLDPLQILALRLFANMSGQKELLISRTSGGDSVHILGDMNNPDLLKELNSIEDMQEFEVNLDEMATWGLVTIEYGTYSSKRYKLAKEGYTVIKDHPEFKSTKK